MRKQNELDGHRVVVVGDACADAALTAALCRRHRAAVLLAGNLGLRVELAMRRRRIPTAHLAGHGEIAAIELAARAQRVLGRVDAVVLMRPAAAPPDLIDLDEEAFEAGFAAELRAMVFALQSLDDMLAARAVILVDARPHPPERRTPLDRARVAARIGLAAALRAELESRPARVETLCAAEETGCRGFLRALLTRLSAGRTPG